MSFALRVQGLSKSYGDIPALKDMQLEVSPGRIFGVVGPNGAGKTTLFSVISGFLPADHGTVEIAGQTLAPGQPPAKGALGVLPQDAGFLAELDLGLQLTHYGELQGLEPARAAEEARRVLELVGLAEVFSRKAKTLSHGMHKRVGIAQAFIGDPALVILDEPTAGLDPHAAKDIRALLRRIQGQRTVIVSSHNLGEVEDLCHEVAIVDRGRLVRQDSIAGVIGGAQLLVIRLARPPAEAELARLRSLAFVTEVAWSTDNDRLRVHFDANASAPGPAARDVIAAMVESGLPFVELQVGKSLEERFLEETRG
jgi:ABC-type multidrug transport system ATPase subunit